MESHCALFARGEFAFLVNSFQQAGFVVQQPLDGVLEICAVASGVERQRILISVGVHGDETAPIEMMALLLEELSKTPKLLAVDLMIVVGNVQAIAKATRFIDVDLNRLFTPHRTEFNQTQEGLRADQLMQVAAQFFDGYKHKWHLDLHTAIRASIYPTFAIVPGKNNPAFLSWLGSAGIAAVVLSPQTSVTFSSYTCAQLGVVSCTAELGRVGELGKNDLTQFAATQHAMGALLRSGMRDPEKEHASTPLVFRVQQELIKKSAAFQLTFDGNTKNFTEFPPGAVLATDGERTYSVGVAPEYVLFPNPSVRIGTRAGIMVVRL